MTHKDRKESEKMRNGNTWGFAGLAIDLRHDRDWHSGIENWRQALSASKSWLYVNITVLEAEELLGTEYFMYEHPNGVQAVGMS